MNKFNEAKKFLILNGYTEEIAEMLPNLYIKTFLEKEKERLSEELEIFLNNALEDPYIEEYSLAMLYEMQREDLDENGNWHGLYKTFQEKMERDFLSRVKRRPFRDYLIKNGLLKLIDGNYLYTRKIVEDPEDYQNLCFLRTSFGDFYIKFSELLDLLKELGCPDEGFTIKANHTPYKNKYITLYPKKIREYYDNQGPKRILK